MLAGLDALALRFDTGHYFIGSLVSSSISLLKHLPVNQQIASQPIVANILRSSTIQTAQ
jgi:hypothetical protein